MRPLVAYFFDDPDVQRLRSGKSRFVSLFKRRLAPPREPLNNSAQAWMGRVVPFFGDVQASL